MSANHVVLGTGAIGRAVAKELVKRGESILTRASSKPTFGMKPPPTREAIKETMKWSKSHSQKH